MKALKMTIVASLTVGFVGCGEDAAPREVDASEWLPGGATTNTRMLGSNAFAMPAENLTPEQELLFFGGNAFFNQGWVEAPASTENRDGLGPLFNARSCSGCHFRDGRAAPPESGEGPFVGLLLRLSVPGPDGPAPDGIYGGQLQDQALPGMWPEAVPRITWEEIPGTYADGTPYTLAAPTYHLDSPGYGPFPDDLMVSPRVAPHMVGLGLLEAIPVARLEALADPDDADGDGVSGRIQWHETADGPVVGRFGWKCDAPDVEAQSAGAFAGDMGLTSHPVPLDDCSDAQPECDAHPHGGEPEITPEILERVVLYSRTLGPPARRNANDPQVLRGQDLFNEMACTSCHVPSHVTGAAALPQLEDQLIYPYTDLLLHDMGDDLSDHRPLGVAEGSEWRTAPLWGIGLIDDVNGHTRFLHDGRARSIEEAILWHGGEAEAHRERFRHLNSDDRAALVAFLEDL